MVEARLIPLELLYPLQLCLKPQLRRFCRARSYASNGVTYAEEDIARLRQFRKQCGGVRWRMEGWRANVDGGSELTRRSCCDRCHFTVTLPWVHTVEIV